jgi:hypothetical protein
VPAPTPTVQATTAAGRRSAFLCVPGWASAEEDMICVLRMQDFISDVQGIGKPFAWVGGRLSGLLPTSGAVSQPAELPERVPMDLNVEVEQTGAAIGEVQQVIDLESFY